MAAAARIPVVQAPWKRAGVCAVLVLAVALGGCGAKKPRAATSTTTAASGSDAASAASDAPLEAVAAAKVWIAERQARLDRFDVASTATLGDGDCAAQAEEVRGAVGDFGAWIAEVGAAPDRILSESLLAASLGVRSTLTACLGAKEMLVDQRGALENALSAVRARRERIAGA